MELRMYSCEEMENRGWLTIRFRMSVPPLLRILGTLKYFCYGNPLTVTHTLYTFKAKELTRLKESEQSTDVLYLNIYLYYNLEDLDNGTELRSPSYMAEKSAVLKDQFQEKTFQWNTQK
ncbi:13927_t:CDS:2 [Funneliformis geosporum]|uniref:13927_t:CDS:1 n=1 Tax=Funneliformis geosporum TaxID=1117311 RepID=A0A9W4SK75_9GLOM|nr:13927_t:CDS:2 [Funneliformis geosporum]